jgi:hypothetical protein
MFVVVAIGLFAPAKRRCTSLPHCHRRHFPAIYKLERCGAASFSFHMCAGRSFKKKVPSWRLLPRAYLSMVHDLRSTRFVPRTRLGVHMAHGYEQAVYPEIGSVTGQLSYSGKETAFKASNALTEMFPRDSELHF